MCAYELKSVDGWIELKAMFEEFLKSLNTEKEVVVTLQSGDQEAKFIFTDASFFRMKNSVDTEVVTSTLGFPLSHDVVQAEQNSIERRDDKYEPTCDGAADDMDTVQECLIVDREKIKETDEYKQADAEEWASRQQALRLQAEEAVTRLVLKRKKTESMCLQDMEKRQKQWVEEIQEAQQKEDENKNLKEKIRSEVRMELEKLEAESSDMASLLRGLGVHVTGGTKPQQHEIRAAYRKALLVFHPDRVIAWDIRKLVEAEEKFKLILCMRDKFSAA